VEEQERRVQTSDDEILVVAGVGDDRRMVAWVAREILEQPAALDTELDLIARVVQLRGAERPIAIDRVEVERRRAGVRGGDRGRWLAQPGRRVEGDVVIQELAHESRPGRMGGAVGVVHAERRVDNQGHRPRRQLVLGIQNPPGRAQRQQGLPHLIGRGCERGPLEHDTETAGAGGVCRARRMGDAEGSHTPTESFEELATAERPLALASSLLPHGHLTRRVWRDYRLRWTG
jgi:hypothetical protein